MKKIPHILILLALGLIPGCASGTANKEEVKKITISQVPETAMEAVRHAAPGINMTEAEATVQDGEKIYTVKGTSSGGKAWKIKVTTDGKILELNTDAEGKGTQSRLRTEL